MMHRAVSNAVVCRHNGHFSNVGVRFASPGARISDVTEVHSPIHGTAEHTYDENGVRPDPHSMDAVANCSATD